MSVPTAIAPRIHPKLLSGSDEPSFAQKKTTSVAIVAPTAPILFPRRAVFGFDKPLRADSLGSTFLGYYNGSAWKTYMANNGNFFLSGAGSDSLSWSGGVLSINGAINITGGNAATTTNVTNAATNAVTSVAGLTGLSGQTKTSANGPAKVIPVFDPDAT